MKAYILKKDIELGKYKLKENQLLNNYHRWFHYIIEKVKHE